MDQNKKSIFLKIVSKIVPPRNWKIPIIVLSGIFAGLFLQILVTSNALSYLSDDPAVCVNCHVMASYHATWERGSHGRVTTCNDCHVPHDSYLKKMLFKVQDGMRHATMFTLRLEPQVINIKDAGKHAVQKNCIRCHLNLIHPVSLRNVNDEMISNNGERFCWDCHRETPHGRVNSLTSAPYARVPRLSKIMPHWLEKFIEIETDNKLK